MTSARLGIIALALCCLAGACVGIYDAISAYNVRYRSEAKMRLYQPLAENGNPDAQFELGVMYHSGFGAPVDLPKSLFWYRKAAAQHSAKAERNLASAYYNGEGVEKDLAQAAFWFRRAAADGDRYSQHNIGQMYAVGEGVERDKTRARYWFDQENMSAEERRLVEGLYMKD
jgi:TPR repeat protein